MYTLITAILEHLTAGHDIACATVIKQAGSSPRGIGAKLIADENGTLIAGTVGGGLLEKRAQEHCARVLREGRQQKLDIDLTNTLAANSGMICGGTMQILVEPLKADESTLTHFRNLASALGLPKDAPNSGKRTSAVVLTSLQDEQPRRFLFTADDSDTYTCTDPTLPTGLKEKFSELLNSGTELPAAAVCSVDDSAWFVESYQPAWRMILLGGGHVSYFTSKIASIAGFEVCVMDDREEFASAERFPEADVRVLDSFSDCFSSVIPDTHTCVVIVTRGHMYDAEVLYQALQTRAGYIGMIGSKRKRNEIYTALLQQGITQEQLDSVYSPIGVTIKAETPEEIAVSITAECIAFRRGMRA